ncbi:S-adenosyl-L-methionine-dependent methyltransferase [Ascobolus immersus RN42]|uniref:S-adenosyl-L-methionine-dependent methyltransferase n=1 Tax=Ascobolus immersus RN42 TaxID=1160509 RepID=A0A3N4IZX7_ASCIM|nr:S-adenosyl-L-methionine-dependent methyltransferase [Ascobolus immersus RN42]
MTSSTTEAHAAFAATNAEFHNKQASEIDSKPYIRPYLHFLHESFSLPPTQSLIFPAGEPRPLKVLDYCCGTGNFTISLLPFLPPGSTVHGVDVSDASIAVYNKKFAPDAESKPNDKVAVTGYTADLSSGDGLGTGPVAVKEEEGGEFWGYDLVLIGMGTHHLPEPSLGVKNLAKRLKAGGKLFIMDNVPGGNWEVVRQQSDKAAKKKGGHGHGHGHHHGHHGDHGKDAEGEKGEILVSDTVSAHGFTEEEVRKMFGNAGLEDVKFTLTGMGFLFKPKNDGSDEWEGDFVNVTTGGEAGEGSADAKSEAEKPTECFFAAGIKA